MTISKIKDNFLDNSYIRVYRVTSELYINAPNDC